MMTHFCGICYIDTGLFNNLSDVFLDMSDMFISRFPSYLFHPRPREPAPK